MTTKSTLNLVDGDQLLTIICGRGEPPILSFGDKVFHLTDEQATEMFAFLGFYGEFLLRSPDDGDTNGGPEGNDAGGDED